MYRLASASLRSRGLGVALATSALFGASVTHSSGHEEAHAASQPWNHQNMRDAYDAASLRRGYEVYRQVCSTCHSLKLVHFRDLVGFTHTKDQAKALAESYEVVDGFDDCGEPATRKGKLNDILPNPYPNVETARFANAGAMPPDLSTMVIMRGECEDSSAGVSQDYIFSLLTGFGHAPPFGVSVEPGQHYNPWFGGGIIAMAAPLIHESLDYEDGTIATESQMAKDVTTFLCFASSPYHDERKYSGWAALGAFTVGALCQGWKKRWRWGAVKNTKISYVC